MDIERLKDYGADKRLVKILSGAGARALYPPQELAVKAGLLQEKGSFVIAAPTASGKTFIAEMAFMDIYLRKGGKTLYLVPLRALASEKYREFSKKYGGTGIRIIEATGDYDSPAPWLAFSDLVIATNEKLDSLIRHRAGWLSEVRLVVADEVHLLGDGHRGPVLEIVLTMLRTVNPGLRVIALSATIPNSAIIARWLGAKLIESSWRPVPLREGVYYNGAGIFNDGTVRWIKQETALDAVNAALDTVREGGQALIFVNTRRSAEAVAKKAAEAAARTVTETDRVFLEGLSEKILGSTSEPTRLCRKLAECVRDGASFHHAGINAAQRRLVEDSFRDNRLKIVVATTTLAMGLNLPSRRVIIRDWWRYEGGLGMKPVSVMEIKQMAGRAGRPGFDEYGEALLMARSRRDEKYLFEDYVKGVPEDVESRLGSPEALRSHMLALISGGFTTAKKELWEFLGATFFAAQAGLKRLKGLSEDILLFLSDEGMAEVKKGKLSATRFGKRTSELYIDPLTGAVLRDGLMMDKEKTAVGYLHLISMTPDMAALSVRKKDFVWLSEFFYQNRSKLLMPGEEAYPSEDVLSALKTAAALMDWISEAREDDIVGRFDIGPGDLRNLVDLADWLIYSASEIGKVFKLKADQKPLSTLRVRVRYGVREDLLDLVSLRGIGRVRARALFSSGYEGLEDIRKASAASLAKVQNIGKAIAEDIKRQAEE